MEENSTINLYIKSLYEQISIEELEVLTNSTQEEIEEQKMLHQAFCKFKKKISQPSLKSICAILKFSEDSNPKLDPIH